MNECTVCGKTPQLEIRYHDKIYDLECFAIASRTDPKLMSIGDQFWGFVDHYNGKTDWHCEECGRRGYVEHDRHADVWSVIQAIFESHDKYDCPEGRNKITVRITR